MTSQLFPLFPIYLDKVLSVTDGDTKRTFTYHADGQLASASCGGIGRAHTPGAPQTETFQWDGLALIQRGDEQFINEPHIGNAPKKLRFGGKPRAQRSARRARKGPCGNPVASSKGTSFFNDMLGTTVGAKKGSKYSAAALSAFGENLAQSKEDMSDHSSFSILHSPFFTGKPYVEGLGHAFLFRNYRAGLAKWQTADPMGYPDGWNQLAYCNNGVTSAVDLWGCEIVRQYETEIFHRYGWDEIGLEPFEAQGQKERLIPNDDPVEYLKGVGLGQVKERRTENEMWTFPETAKVHEWYDNGYRYVSTRTYEQKIICGDIISYWEVHISTLRDKVGCY